ncbi:MAG: E2 ligase fold family C protein [Acidimicrobiales bacterium]
MALADYFRRSAVAAAQVLNGYDEDAIAECLESARVAIAIDDGTLEHAEGRHILDLSIRLLARFYPSLTIVGSNAADPWRDLALAINPAIDLDRHEPSSAIVIGTPQQGVSVAPVQLFVGSDGWHARFSARQPQPVGTSTNPLGAGAAACFGAANLFRHVFLGDATFDEGLVLSTRTMQRRYEDDDRGVRCPGGTTVLAGAGAIGNGALWAIGRISDGGETVVIDPEPVELGNLQRYVLAVRTDEGRPKTDVALEHLRPDVAQGIPLTWEAFTNECGHQWERVLVAVDSAGARHAVQASLPGWVANSWTQPGDLGVSVHPWTELGACVACMYIPAGKLPNLTRMNSWRTRSVCLASAMASRSGPCWTQAHPRQLSVGRRAG